MRQTERQRERERAPHHRQTRINKSPWRSRSLTGARQWNIIYSSCLTTPELDFQKPIPFGVSLLNDCHSKIVRRDCYSRLETRLSGDQRPSRQTPSSGPLFDDRLPVKMLSTAARSPLRRRSTRGSSENNKKTRVEKGPARKPIHYVCIADRGDGFPASCLPREESYD